MKAATLLLCVLMLAGCTKPAISEDGTNNAEIRVSELFTHNGVTVYRFTDGGRFIYFTSRAGDVRYSTTQPCGKGCVNTVNVTTLGE